MGAQEDFESIKQKALGVRRKERGRISRNGFSLTEQIPQPHCTDIGSPIGADAKGEMERKSD